MNEAMSATAASIVQFADTETKSRFDDFCHSGYKYFLCLTHRQNYNALENVAFHDGKRYLLFSTGYPAWFDAGDIADTKLGLGTRWTSFKADFLSARAAIREAAKQSEPALGKELAKLENLIVQFKKIRKQSIHVSVL